VMKGGWEGGDGERGDERGGKGEMIKEVVI
jgi:hypothetical protein